MNRWLQSCALLMIVTLRATGFKSDDTAIEKDREAVKKVAPRPSSILEAAKDSMSPM